MGSGRVREDWTQNTQTSWDWQHNPSPIRHYTLNNSCSQPYVGTDDTIKSTFLIRQEVSVLAYVSNL